MCWAQLELVRWGLKWREAQPAWTWACAWAWAGHVHTTNAYKQGSNLNVLTYPCASSAAIYPASVCILFHVLKCSFAPPVVLCMKFSTHSLPLSHAVFLAILHSLVLPAHLELSVVGLPRGAAEVVLLAEVFFCLCQGHVSGIVTVAS